MCLLLELCEAFIWAAIFEAGDSNELMVFATALEETFKVLDIFWID